MTAHKKTGKKIIVIYHGDCPDGFGAAWAAWRMFGKSADYIPVAHHEPPPAGLRGKEVYLLDFTYKASIIKALMAKNARVTAIDHHESREAETKLTEKYSYAVNHSGSVLAWLYFHPQKTIPALLRYVEDRDIWKWRMPNGKKILSVIDLFERDFAVWNKLAKKLESRKIRKEFAAQGELLMRHDDMLMRKLLTAADKVKFTGRTVYALNAPRYFADDLGHILCKKLPPFAVIWREENGLIRVSLRANGKIDVSKIAKRFGGGGHKSASGFSFPFEKKFPWKPTA